MKVEEATAKALQKEALDLKRGKLPAAGETWDIVLIFPFGPPAPSGPLRVSISTATADTWWHWQRYGKRDERLARFSEEKARPVMYVWLLHFFLFIF